MKLVDEGAPPDYPISAQARLDTHYFVPWNLKRWRGSAFRRLAYKDPEVGFYGLELFFLAQDESPIGTLPLDDEAMAFLLRMPVTRWRDLKARPLSPLFGWYRVACDNGQVRLAHAVVTEVALDALDRRDRNQSKNADDRMRRRLKTIVGHLRDGVAGGHELSQNDEAVNAISDWIEAAYPGGSATLKRVKEAIGAIYRRR